MSTYSNTVKRLFTKFQALVLAHGLPDSKRADFTAGSLALEAAKDPMESSLGDSTRDGLKKGLKIE